jgi:chemotaxis-related protein WspD
MENCWKKIGIDGDRSCKELDRVIHCHNCPIYSQGGRQLFDRPPADEYVEEWTRSLAGEGWQSESEPRSTEEQAPTVAPEERDTAIGATGVPLPSRIAIFRLGGEWLALRAELLHEIATPRTIRTVPHRSDDLFLGLVNIRGELLPCVSLNAVLQLHSCEISDREGLAIYPRLVVVESDRGLWVFPVDEIYGIHRTCAVRLETTPAAIACASHSYTRAIVNWHDRKVNYLDDRLLFEAIAHRIL